jgi:hypothetical protein
MKTIKITDENYCNEITEEIKKIMSSDITISDENYVFWLEQLNYFVILQIL